MKFEFAYALDFGSDLNYDCISVTCGVYARMADKVTGGDRSAWGVYVHGTEIGIGFRHEGDRDRFVEYYQFALRSAQADDEKARKQFTRRSGRRLANH